MVALVLLYAIFSVLSSCEAKKSLHRFLVPPVKYGFKEDCDDVCQDLPKNDDQPVCMMFSRYKQYFQYFINECHARRAICKENLLLHLVHKSRCDNGNQYYMPVN